MNNFWKAIFKAATLLEVEILFGDNLSNLTCAVYCYSSRSDLYLNFLLWARISLWGLGICCEANIKILAPDRSCTAVNPIKRHVKSQFFSVLDPASLFFLLSLEGVNSPLWSCKQMSQPSELFFVHESTGNGESHGTLTEHMTCCKKQWNK